MRGNGDFEAKSPAIWEFDFMKRWKHSDFFCWGKCSQLVMAGYSRPKDGVLLQAFVPAIHVLLQANAGTKPDMTPESGAI